MILKCHILNCIKCMILPIVVYVQVHYSSSTSIIRAFVMKWYFIYEFRLNLVNKHIYLNKICPYWLSALKFLIPVYNVFYWAKRRAQMREALGIPGSERNDCLTILCCSYCALMQEAQEVLPCTQPISQRIYRY